LIEDEKGELEIIDYGCIYTEKLLAMPEKA